MSNLLFVISKVSNKDYSIKLKYIVFCVLKNKLFLILLLDICILDLSKYLFI